MPIRRSFATKTVLLFATMATGQTDAVWVDRLSGPVGPANPVGAHLDRNTVADTMS